MAKKLTTKEYVALARRQYHREGEIEIDENAKVSCSKDGAYVQAWVWVYDPRPVHFRQTGKGASK